jgi:hypothetical protein
LTKSAEHTRNGYPFCGCRLRRQGVVDCAATKRDHDCSDGGARVKIDIPEDEMPAIMRLTMMRGRVLQITIAPEPLKNKTKQHASKRHNQQSQWTPREESGDDDDP